MKLKKLICVLLGTAMVLGMAGCGGKGTEELVSKDETPKTEQDSKTLKESAEEEVSAGEKVKLDSLTWCFTRGSICWRF